MPAYHRCMHTLGFVSASTLVAVGLIVPGGRTLAVQNKQGKDLTTALFYGADSCKNCHTAPKKKGEDDFVKLTEYVTWKTQDRHSLAYAVLEGPRGQQMGSILGIKVTDDARCLNCHAMNFPKERQGDDFSIKDGVSCDGCHGPAEHWVGPHAFQRKAWRMKTPEEKEALGMFDVRNPVKRAQMCMSCHVGSAAEGKVVTHAMYAAGHPPLPSFEVASFSENLPAHWYALNEVPFFRNAPAPVRAANHVDNADFEQTKLVLATRTEALRVAMDLLGRRARLDGKLAAPKARVGGWPPPWLSLYLTNEPRARWPELATAAKLGRPPEPAERWPEIMMAQADCAACHHELTSNSWRQLRGYAGVPGRPPFPTWTAALARRLEVPGESRQECVAAQKQLQAALDLQPFGEPGAVSRAAVELERCAGKLRNPRENADRATALALLRQLATLPENDHPDFDTARVLAWAFRAVYTDGWNRKAMDPKVMGVLAALDRDLNLTLQSPARKQFVDARHTLTRKVLNENDPRAFIMDRKGFLQPLQDVSDRETSVTLEKAASYDPQTFRNRMEELSRLIPAR